MESLLLIEDIRFGWFWEFDPDTNIKFDSFPELLKCWLDWCFFDEKFTLLILVFEEAFNNEDKFKLVECFLILS